MEKIYGFAYVSIFVTGACLGSFFNVVIHRLPRGMSIILPPSHCPECGGKIRWYDNIPIISYIILGGKCRSCKKSISPMYPLVELTTATIGLLVVLKWGFSLEGFKFLMLTWSLVPVFFIDLQHLIIPDIISLPLIGAGIIFSATGGVKMLLGSLMGLVSGSLILLITAIVMGYMLKREALGMGDIKLIAGIGAFTGVKGALFTVFAGSITGSLIGTAYLVLSRKHLRTQIPFGPFLVIGLLIYVFFGNEIIQAYLRILHGF